MAAPVTGSNALDPPVVALITAWLPEVAAEVKLCPTVNVWVLVKCVIEPAPRAKL